jgi:uncharacterized protein (TIGR03083 family)
MDRERHLAALRHEGEALAAAARRGLDAPVPSCPEWDVAALVEHVGRIYVRCAEIVRTHSDVEIPHDSFPDPPAGALAGWFEEAHAELVEVLTNEAPDAPAWNWSGANETAAFWLRRMANETAVHRWDAELAHGTPEPVEPELAADGVAEALEVMLPRGLARRPQDGLRGTFTLAATDSGAAWSGELWPDRVELRPGTLDGADATLRGTASDLVLALWGRDVPVEPGGDQRIVDLLTE